MGHYATCRKVVVSIPDEVIRFFFTNLPNPSSRTMVMRLTQPLNRNEYQEYSWEVNGGGRVCLTTLPPSVNRLSRENLQPRRLTPLWVSTACYMDSFTHKNIHTNLIECRPANSIHKITFCLRSEIK
jgi:hypothetical protein